MLKTDVDAAAIDLSLPVDTPLHEDHQQGEPISVVNPDTTKNSAAVDFATINTSFTSENDNFLFDVSFILGDNGMLTLEPNIPNWSFEHFLGVSPWTGTISCRVKFNSSQVWRMLWHEHWAV